MNICITDYDLKVPGKTLLCNTTITLTSNKYGLVGPNGSGKTSFLQSLLTLPLDSITKFLVQQELPHHDIHNTTVYDFVLHSNTPLYNTVHALDNLNENDPNYLHDYEQLHDKLHALQHDKQHSIISKILFGLGFNNITQNYLISQFSGGWKMRISLSRALYLQPDLLLLDEPTNHLDLDATIWLTEYLQHIKSTVIIVSHNQTLLNSVCDYIIFLDTDTKKLLYYKGNYDSFITMKTQQQQKIQKDWDKMITLTKKLKTTTERNNFITNSGLPKPAISYEPKITFLQPTTLRSQNPLVIENVSFNYTPDTPVLHGINISINCSTRITVVGKNGSGKSTFLRLLHDGDVCSGEIIKDNRLVLGYYHQHCTDHLNPQSTPIETITDCNKQISQFDARKMLGSIGLHGSLHNNTIDTLSGGQKSRVALCIIIAKQPHILLLDEPTNHLDIETVNALILALNNFKGGVVMVTHDEKLITETDCRLWVCENHSVTPFKGDYDDYKQYLLAV